MNKIMAIVGPTEILAEALTGKVGRSSEYGQREYGDFEYGEFEEIFGIYRRRPGPEKTTLVKNIFYWPFNPQSETQQAWRVIFEAGVVAWQNLNEAEKEEFREKAKYKKYSGFNLFMSEYLFSH